MAPSQVEARSRGRTAPTDTSNPQYFHKVVDCQWACPTHTPVPEYIRLIAQGRYAAAFMLNWESNVFPGDPGPRLRPPVRAGLPARPRRGEAGRHLPPEARRRRLQGRDRCVHAGDPEAEERQAHRADRRRPGLAHGCARSDAARLQLRAVREGPQGRRADAHQHPLLPPAGDGAGRGDRAHSRLRRRDALRPRDQEPRSAARGEASTPSSSAPARPRARTSTFPAARKRRPTSTSASTG